MRTQTKLTGARLLSRLVRLGRISIGLGPTAVVRRNGLLWDLDLREGVDLSIYLLGRFEREVSKALDRAVLPGSHVIDIGANIGAHALPVARRAGADGRVICYEPSDFAFSKLKRNLQLNGHLSAVECSQVFLSGSPGDECSDVFASWPLERVAGTHPLHGGRPTSTTGARVTTLDAEVDQRNLSRIDVLKLDVDGNEFGVLEGASGTLDRYRPIIVMEIAPHVLDEGPHSVEELLERLAHFGYVLHDPRDNHMLPMDADWFRSTIPHGGGTNVVARVPRR